MATRTTLKGYFQTGDKPTQSEFAELIEGVPNLTDSSVTDAEFSYLNGTTSAIQTQIDGKQATLVNQTNIKSVNGETLLGSGDLTVSSSAAWGGITGTLSSQTDLQSALDLKEDVIAAGTTSEYYRGDKTFVALDKTAVGLPNVDNTSDANKPVSTATQTELDEKQDTISLTTTGTSGVATFVGSTLNVPDYGSAASSVAWGDITGTLSNQTDLDTALDLKADLAGATFTGDVTAPDFIGDLNGAVRFTAKNESGATLLKGKVVAIIGVSGTETTVDLADADNASARPAFGLVYADANNNAAVEVVTLGELAGLDTSAFSEGDTLYVDTTAGGLTTTPPTGEAADIQNIGRVIRSHASAGIIRVGGAGRANQTPNLDSAKIFLGNASNQSVPTAVTGEVTISNTGVTEVTSIDGNISIQGFRPYSRETTTERTLSLADAGTFISAENVGGTEVTIPTNASVAFTQGTEIDFIQKTAGALSIAGDTGVTLNGAVAGSVEVTAQWGGVTIKLIADDEWIAVGKI